MHPTVQDQHAEGNSITHSRERHINGVYRMACIYIARQYMPFMHRIPDRRSCNRSSPSTQMTLYFEAGVFASPLMSASFHNTRGIPLKSKFLVSSRRCYRGWQSLPVHSILQLLNETATHSNRQQRSLQDMQDSIDTIWFLNIFVVATI